MEGRNGHRVYHRPKGQKMVLGQREKRRLCQLGVCLTLFFAVFFLRGGMRSAYLSEELRTLLQTNADFRGALTRLGQARQSERPLGETVSTFIKQVFSFEQRETYSPQKNGPLFCK